MLGSGQLGRMFAMAATRMGYRVHTFSPDEDTPTGQVAELEITASFDDLDAIRAFARNVDVVTFEFENVSAAAAAVAGEHAPVRPSGHILHITQQRAAREGVPRRRRFSRDAVCARPHPPATWRTPSREIGMPAVLKTASFGYDGKGQRKVAQPRGGRVAWDELGGQEAVLERSSTSIARSR